MCFILEPCCSFSECQIRWNTMLKDKQYSSAQIKSLSINAIFFLNFLFFTKKTVIVEDSDFFSQNKDCILSPYQLLTWRHKQKRSSNRQYEPKKWLQQVKVCFIAHMDTWLLLYLEKVWLEKFLNLPFNHWRACEMIISNRLWRWTLFKVTNAMKSYVWVRVTDLTEV